MLLCVWQRREAFVDALEGLKPRAVDPEFQKNASGVAYALARDVNQIPHYAGESPPLDLEPDRKCLRTTQRLLAERTQKVEANTGE